MSSPAGSGAAKVSPLYWSPANIDFGPFDPSNTDDTRIGAGQGHWLPCRIHEHVFGQLVPTYCYCIKCKVAACEDGHGRFVKNGPYFCVRCYPMPF